MTLAYSTAGALLKSTIQSIALESSDPLYSADFQAAYRDQAREQIHPVVQLELVLAITSSRETLTGERFTSDESGLGSTMHGMRDFTLNVQAKSFDLSYDAWAFTYLERVRTRIQRRSVLDTLIANQIAFVSAGPIVDVLGKEDGHATSVANLDLYMRLSFEDTPTLGLDYFEKIELTGHVQKPDGTEYPAPPNATDLLIPPG